MADGDSGSVAADRIAALTVDVPDFPQPGIVFKDLTPLFSDGPAFAATIDVIRDRYADGFDTVAGIEARGFMIGAAVAYAAGVGFVPIRKAGKLPRDSFSETYALEYGQATIEVHTDAFTPGQRVLLIDDVLATGGTAEAACRLLDQAGAQVVAFETLVELAFLPGRERLPGREIHATVVVT